MAAKLEHARLESAAHEEGDRLTTGRYAWTLEATMLEVRFAFAFCGSTRPASRLVWPWCK